MNIKIKVVSLLLAVIMVAGVFSGCAIGGVDKDEYGTLVVATYGEDKIYLDEANFFIRNAQYVYEMYYGTDVWSNTQYEGIKDYMVESVMASLNQTSVLVSKAEELGVTLSDEDKAKAAEAVAEFLEEADEKLVEACGLSEERLIEIYEKNALANRVYETTYTGKDFSVTDKEAEQRTVSYILVPSASGEDKAKEVLDKVSADGADMEKIAKEYNFSYSTLTFGDADYDNEIGTVSAGMEEGEYAIANVSSDGWYVMYMKDKVDESATKNKKAALEEEKKVAIFKEVYAAWVEAGPKFDVDEDVLDIIKFKTAIYEVPESTAAATETTAAATETTEAAAETTEAAAE